MQPFTAPKVRLSLALITKNEERCLARCLTSIREIVDEIIVVDTGSADGTVRIALDFGAKVFSFDWVDDFSAARNDSLARVTGDWILVLDADEYASEALRQEIVDFVKGPPLIGRMKIVSDFRQGDQVLQSQSFVSRLFPRGARFEGRIHEQLLSALPRKNLQRELWHDGYMQAGKSDRNVKLLRQELNRNPSSTYLLYQLAVEHASLKETRAAFGCLQKAMAMVRPKDPFAVNLVVDLLYASMELKEFEIGLAAIQTAKDWSDDFPDFHLVCGLFYMQLVRSDPAKHIAFLPEIGAAFQRCLQIGETDRFKSVHGAGSFLAQYNLGTFYHVFGEDALAMECFQASAEQGYAPASAILKKLSSK